MDTPQCAVCALPGEHVVAFTVDGEFAATFPLCRMHVRAIERHDWLLRLYGDHPTLQLDGRDARRGGE